MYVGKATCNIASNSGGFWSTLWSFFLMQVLDWPDRESVLLNLLLVNNDQGYDSLWLP